jgi:hypothetical protein
MTLERFSISRSYSNGYATGGLPSRIDAVAAHQAGTYRSGPAHHTPKLGSGGRDRTCDGLVNSQMLLPLSYSGIKLYLYFMLRNHTVVNFAVTITANQQTFLQL